jgi:hypothetical protein
MVVWVTPDLVVRPMLNSQCQASRLILSRENSTPRCVMFDLRLPIRWRIRVAGSRNTRCSKTNSSAHNGKGICRAGFSEAVSLRRLQLAASDPPRSRDGFEWIPRFALLAGERTPALATGRRRQNKGGPALGACRSFVLSHGSNLPPDSLASPFQIQAVEKNNSLTCRSRMEGDPSAGEPAKNGPPGFIQEASFTIRAKRIGRPT